MPKYDKGKSGEFSQSSEAEEIGSSSWGCENACCHIHAVANVECGNVERDRSVDCGEPLASLNVKVDVCRFDVSVSDPSLETCIARKFREIAEYNFHHCRSFDGIESIE